MPKFPAAIHLATTKSGKNQIFTLNRLLNHPERYHLVGYFLKILNENLKQDSKHAILVSRHPRLGLLAVTDLNLESDVLVFQFYLSRALLKDHHPLNLAEVRHLLRAMHRQGVWSPEAR